uniref:Microfibrillar-associated protein 2 n=1 Tax=Zonotrichia albicollis TaxID=44394 RepID=A0A8D2M9N6_ZONAL
MGSQIPFLGRCAPLTPPCPAALLVQGQFSRFEGITYPEPVQYSQYDQQAGESTAPPRGIAGNCRELPGIAGSLPADCREEQYPCTRLYSVHKPCKQCLNEICFYSLRRVYVINKEICVRTVCAHEELLRGERETGTVPNPIPLFPEIPGRENPVSEKPGPAPSQSRFSPKFRGGKIR